MLKTLFVAAAVAAATLAPQNDSIRQDDLRADLFFLAGDSLRGRLTDTEENRAAADFIRSRFERMGLKPAAPNNSYFQAYNLMTATLGDGNALDIIVADGASRHLRSGTMWRSTAVWRSTRAPGSGSGAKPRAVSADRDSSSSDFPVPATSDAARAGEICATGMWMRSAHAASV